MRIVLSFIKSNDPVGVLITTVEADSLRDLDLSALYHKVKPLAQAPVGSEVLITKLCTCCDHVEDDVWYDNADCKRLGFLTEEELIASLN